jgi:hypothetical protein
MDFLHTCGEGKSASADDHSEFSADNARFPLFIVVAAAPLAGILFDLLLPLPSSLVHSILVSIFGSAFVAFLWVLFKHQGSRSPKFYLVNLKNFVYTPNLLKMYGGNNGKKVVAIWVSVIAASAAVQIFLFTPGNASYLARQVSSQIDNASGANLQVVCPSTRFFFYNEKIECRVKTGLLGISVPARVDISPFLGTAEIKVSLL